MDTNSTKIGAILTCSQSYTKPYNPINPINPINRINPVNPINPMNPVNPINPIIPKAKPYALRPKPQPLNPTLEKYLFKAGGLLICYPSTST